MGWMLPDMAQAATGLALAFKMRREPRVAMSFFGIHRLPAVFVLENNKYAFSTPQALEYAVDPVERARGYGFPGVAVDGNDVEAVFEAARGAAGRARGGE